MYFHTIVAVRDARPKGNGEALPSFTRSCITPSTGAFFHLLDTQAPRDPAAVPWTYDMLRTRSEGGELVIVASPDAPVGGQAPTGHEMPHG